MCLDSYKRAEHAANSLYFAIIATIASWFTTLDNSYRMSFVRDAPSGTFFISSQSHATGFSPGAQRSHSRWPSPALTVGKFATCFAPRDSPGCAGWDRYLRRATALINCCSFSCCGSSSSAEGSDAHSGLREGRRYWMASLPKEYSYQLSSYQWSSHYCTRSHSQPFSEWSCFQSWRTWRGSWATAPSSCSGTADSPC